MSRVFTTGRVGLAALVAAAALAYAWLPWVTTPDGSPRLFNSPDETANHAFALVAARTGRLAIREPLNTEFNGIIHPRSVAAVGDRLVPGGFLGLPLLYGALARLVGEGTVVYLTPALAALTLAALWWLYRAVFGAASAWVALPLVATLPAWWYYAARSMFPNVAFAALLAWAAVLWWRWLQPVNARLGWGVGAVALTAVALWVRPSEGVWVLPVLLAAGVARRRQQSAASWLAVSAVGLLLAWPFLWVSWQTYGVPWGSGYRVAVPAAETVGAAAALTTRDVLLPFGFHPRRAFNRLYDYTLGLFWWLLWPALAGWLLSLGRWHLLPVPQRGYLVLTTSVGAYLALYYGSWRVVDHLNPAAVTLGTSYVRYWLPLYLLALPYAAVAAQLALQRWGPRGRRLTLALLVALATAVSAHRTLLAGDESLTAVAERIGEYYIQRRAVLQRVEPDAVVVTERHDKVFFPTLAVVSDVGAPDRLVALARLAARRPLYYYTWLAPHDVARVAARFSSVGLRLGAGERIGTAETLYPLRLGDGR